MSSNILLKTLYEVKLFFDFIQTEILRKKKYTYLIISEIDYFEIDELKTYLIENELTDFAKKELLELARLCDSFLELEDRYKNMQVGNIGYSYQFINAKTQNEYTSIGNNELRYYVKHNNKLVRILDEDYFSKLFKLENQILLNYNYHKLFNPIREILKLSIKYLDIESLNELRIPEINNTKKSIEQKNTHPKHNPNYWSLQCYNLFKYLFDNYYISKNRQLTNIWFFLNEYDPVRYNLKATKEKYSEFIQENYNIKITNFDKATYKYSKEFGTMNDHRMIFEDDYLDTLKNT